MFRTLARKFLPNPLDRMLKQAAKKGGRRILLGWNRGLGDIALGLYAIVQRIREIIPNAEITFATRDNLVDGFSLLEGVRTVVMPDWKRGGPAKIDKAMKRQYDLVIEKPSPTDWVSWQRGKIVPKLRWDRRYDGLHEKFSLSEDSVYVGVQVSAETQYGLWRNWPLERWKELFERLEAMHIQAVLFGYGDQPQFSNGNLIDLRGKTTLFELLSLIKHRISALILPDSGISSMIYYLDESFPIRHVTLWADPNHGILKQRVPSPNPELIHCPLIAEKRDLSTVSVDAVVESLVSLRKTAAILLAGGQGSRLGFKGPKGLFSIDGKTLFEYFCEKVPKGRPVAIMTSPLNHDETIAYFRNHDCFGLDIYFFQQEMASVLDMEKRPTSLQAPNGNGGVFRSFVRSGLGEQFAERGIDLVTVNYVDNPLGDPFDLALIAQALLKRAEIAVQCVERRPEDRSMGALIEKEGKWEVVEYTELGPLQECRYSYSGQLAIDLAFFRRMGEVELPIHWVRKTMEGRPVWKGEQFIFDVFPFAKKIAPFPVSRQTHYAPIKGPESIPIAENRLREKVCK
ncbi:MAG: UTP--glucose-1-phosphate uridylyltransferase [Chlamydiales bacterium]